MARLATPARGRLRVRPVPASGPLPQTAVGLGSFHRMAARVRLRAPRSGWVLFTRLRVGCVSRDHVVGFVFANPCLACRVECFYRFVATRPCPPLVEVERGQPSDRVEIGQGHGVEVAACAPHRMTSF